MRSNRAPLAGVHTCGGGKEGRYKEKDKSFGAAEITLFGGLGYTFKMVIHRIVILFVMFIRPIYHTLNG
jgi:hypothetical protein